MHNTRRRGALATSFLAASLALAACSGGGGGNAGNANNDKNAQLKEGGVLNYGADQPPPEFNPNTSGGNATATKNITINLLPTPYIFTPDYKVTPNKNYFDSAEVTSQDPQEVTYKINPKAVWSDGVPVSADDIRYMWENMNGTKKDNDVKETAGYELVSAVESKDGGKTAVVKFKDKYSSWQGMFLDLLPAHWMKAQKGGWNDALDTKPLPISAGPFKIESFNKDKDLTLVRNDKWWGPKPHLDKIVFRFLSESASQPAALKNKEVDVIYPQPQLDLVQQIKSQPDLVSEVNFGLSYEHIDFNFKNADLAQLEVRQAIAKGIDRDDIVRRTVGQFDPKAQRVDNRIYVTGQPEYQPHGQDYAKRDVAGAQALLEKAGYAKGANGIYAKNGKPLSLRISTTQGNALREQEEQLMQAQLKEVGIDIKIVNTTADEYFGTWLPKGNFDIGLFAWVSNPLAISASYDSYRTGGGGNYGKYASKVVDDAFAAGAKELDQSKIAELMNKADEQMWTDMNTVPLFQKATFVAYRNTLVNVHDNATQDGIFWNSFLWGYKAGAQ